MQSADSYSPDTSEAASQPAQANPKARRKRVRYTSHACTVCQRRKIKCSGENPCATCKASESRCQYTESLQRGRPKGSRITKKETTVQNHEGDVDRTVESDLSIRLRQLEEEIRSIRRSQCDAQSLQANRGTHDLSVSTNDVLPGNTTADSTKNAQSDMNSSTIHVSQPDMPRVEESHNSVSPPEQCADLRNFRPSLEVSEPPKEFQGQKRTRQTDILQESEGALGHLFGLLHFANNLDDNIYFFIKEFGYWFPCSQIEDIRPRLQNLLQYPSLRQNSIVIDTDEPHSLSLAAFVCMIMAVSEFLKENGSAVPLDGDKTGCWPTHEDWYAESCKLLGRCHALQEIDALRQSILSALYQLMLEHLAESSQAIARAVDIAFALDLNNENHWVGFTENDRISRRALWWTLYLLDRRVARKIGRPYYIHDQDALVGDFASDKYPQIQTEATDLGAFPSPRDNLSGQQDLVHDQSWYSYLQFHVEWSRISTQVWDTLYAVRAPHTGDENHIESLDAQVVRLKRNLAPDMTWNTDFLASKNCGQAWDHRLRIQLVIFTRINLLRMWIRRHSISNAQENRSTAHLGSDGAHNARICQDLASETVDAVTRYMQFRKYQRPFATYATMSLVECMYHLLSLPGGYTVKSEQLQRILHSARDCLHKTSLTGLQVAQNSLNLIQDMLDAREKSFPVLPETSTLSWLGSSSSSRFRQEKAHIDIGLFGNVDLLEETAANPFALPWEADQPFEDALWGLDDSLNVDHMWASSHGFDGGFGEQTGVRSQPNSSLDRV